MSESWQWVCGAVSLFGIGVMIILGACVVRLRRELHRSNWMVEQGHSLVGGVPVDELPWRASKHGRGLYPVVEGIPDDRTPLLGIMESSELASHVVAVHNYAQRRLE